MNVNLVLCVAELCTRDHIRLMKQKKPSLQHYDSAHYFQTVVGTYINVSDQFVFFRKIPHVQAQQPDGNSGYSV